MPEATSTQLAASRRAWRWFWVNLVAEIVLLNIAINLLRAPDLHKYWIPAISAVVGLHFWPMAYFFRTRSYWYVGAAVMIGAFIAAALVVSRDEAVPAIACLEAIANAIIHDLRNLARDHPSRHCITRKATIARAGGAAAYPNAKKRVDIRLG